MEHHQNEKPAFEKCLNNVYSLTATAIRCLKWWNSAEVRKESVSRVPGTPSICMVQMLVFFRYVDKTDNHDVVLTRRVTRSICSVWQCLGALSQNKLQENPRRFLLGLAPLLHCQQLRTFSSQRSRTPFDMITTEPEHCPVQFPPRPDRHL